MPSSRVKMCPRCSAALVAVRCGACRVDLCEDCLRYHGCRALTPDAMPDGGQQLALGPSMFPDDEDGAPEL